MKEKRFQKATIFLNNRGGINLCFGAHAEKGKNRMNRKLLSLTYVLSSVTGNLLSCFSLGYSSSARHGFKSANVSAETQSTLQKTTQISNGEVHESGILLDEPIYQLQKIIVRPQSAAILSESVAASSQSLAILRESAGSWLLAFKFSLDTEINGTIFYSPHFRL